MLENWYYSYLKNSVQKLYKSLDKTNLTYQKIMEILINFEHSIFMLNNSKTTFFS